MLRGTGTKRYSEVYTDELPQGETRTAGPASQSVVRLPW